jgi:hypothetical protein
MKRSIELTLPSSSLFLDRRGRASGGRGSRGGGRGQ